MFCVRHFPFHRVFFIGFDCKLMLIYALSWCSSGLLAVFLQYEILKYERTHERLNYWYWHKVLKFTENALPPLLFLPFFTLNGSNIRINSNKDAMIKRRQKNQSTLIKLFWSPSAIHDTFNLAQFQEF